MTPRLFLFTFVCTVVVQHVASSLTFIRYDKDAALDGKVCSTTDVVFSIRIPGYGDNNLILCTERCRNSAECVSIFYDSATFMCTGCNGVYNVTSSLEVSVGTVHYLSNTRLYQQNCLPDHVCKEPNQECFTDTCICSPGYSYNPNNKTCVERCETYGTTFQMYDNRRIHSDNLYTVNGGITANECLIECISDPMCVSVDHSSSNCNIQSVSVLTTSTYFEVIQTYNFYTRNCA